MTRYTFDQLEVYGTLGETPRTIARIVPTLAMGVKGMDQMVDIVHAVDDTGIEADVVDGLAVLLEVMKDREGYEVTPPIPMKKDHCFYAGPDAEHEEYVSHAEAYKRIRSFADEKRMVGDTCFRAGDMKGALAAYELGAAASQTPKDYARMIITKLLNDERRALIVGWIRDTEPDVDLKVLCEQVLRDITNEAS